MPAFIVIGMLYGDEGKGTITDYLVRRHKAQGVVKFNGGAQHAHNVVASNGQHHTFRQFGAGTFAGAETHLSRYFLVNPHMLYIEQRLLRAHIGGNPLELISVDGNALITTQFHVSANRMREAERGDSRHGSCGMGIGETVETAMDGYELRAGDIANFDTIALRRRLQEIHELKAAQLEVFRNERSLSDEWKYIFDPVTVRESIDVAIEVYQAFARHVRIFNYTFVPPPDETWVFEGGQGVLLDQDYGFHPYTTWSKTTPENAMKILADYGGEIKTYGVLRSYMTRHGAGPFVTEHSPDKYERNAPGRPYYEEHNTAGEWQGGWRTGALDLVALRYALRAAQTVDELAVTHMDRLRKPGDQPWAVCHSYNSPAGDVLDDIGEILPQSIAEQEELTNFIRSCGGNYWQYTTGITWQELMDVIQRETEYPVTIVSQGPEATEKSEKVGLDL
jgi:adenylosuccinate synthase